MEKRIAGFLLAFFVATCGVASGPSEAGAIVLPWKKEHIDALRVFQFLNYIDFGLAEAIDTGDSLVLTRQYDILAGNLDLAVVRDEQVIRVVEDLGKLVDRTETGRLAEQVDRIFSTRLTDAIYRGLSAGSTMAESISREVARYGAPWYDYRGNRAIYTDRMRGKIALTEGQTRRLTEIRKDMLRISWELFGKYEVGKNERLNEKDMDLFVSIIDKDDPLLRSRQLKRLLHDQPAFEAFPPFWFYSGMAETEKQDGDGLYGIICFDRYADTYRNIFKKDPLMAMAGMVRLTLTSKENRGQRITSLDMLKSNCSASDWQYYLISAVAEADLGLIPQAREDLLRNIDNDRQASLSGRVLASSLMEAKDFKGFDSAMAGLLSDRRIKAGDMISLAAACETAECRDWLNREIKSMALLVAGAESKCARIEVPSSWIDFPCSMDIKVTWADGTPGWETSLSSTALAVLPKGDGGPENRLVETPVISGDPGLPPFLETRILHPLFEISAGWELIPPDEGVERDILMGLGKAFPFYRPEAGRYSLMWYSAGKDRVVLKEPDQSPEKTPTDFPISFDEVSPDANRTSL